MVEWLAGNRIKGTSTERATTTVSTPPTISTDGNYTVLKYTEDGVFIPKGSFNVEYLVVGGGGSGAGSASDVGGGGGAGAFRTATGHAVTAQSYNITVGAGGVGVAGRQNGNAGGDSTFDTITMNGGGYGGEQGNNGGNSATGSGGGGGWTSTSASSSGSYGNNGGSSANGSGALNSAGGGGGSGSAGQNGQGSSVGGAGGNGTSSSITGSAVTYAVGGGGGGYGGTSGVGGAGGSSTTTSNGSADANSSNADPNTGNGSGGTGGSSTTRSSGNGGSGIVIIRFLTSGNDYLTTAEIFMPTLQSPSVGGWVELARTTLGTTGDTISVTSLDNKRYYMVLTSAKASGTLYPEVELNGDTGNNYAFRRTINGGTNGTPNGGNNAGQYTALFPSNTDVANGETYFAVDYLSNLSGKEKLAYSCDVFSEADGVGYAPTRQQFGCKWVPTTASDVINRIDRSEYASGEYLADSEVVVLGWDPDDTHTTNFWEELASVDLSGGSATSLSSGTFTAKKYLWVQIYSKRTGTGTQQPTLKVGNGTVATGSPYSFRYSNDGANDLTGINLAKLPLAWLGANKHFTNIFIINNASNEKLVITNDVANVTTGAGSAPQRVESVSKYADTSNQINIIELHDWDGYTFDTQTTMKVWGHD